MRVDLLGCVIPRVLGVALNAALLSCSVGRVVGRLHVELGLLLHRYDAWAGLVETLHRGVELLLGGENFFVELISGIDLLLRTRPGHLDVHY